MSAPARYDDLGTVNAVKLLPKVDSYNGYIKLYTELDSHIEEGDTVFITFSGDTTQLNIATDIILDNYTYVVYDNDFIYNKFAQGYDVIYVDKMNNSFAINRLIFTIPTGKKLYGHYVSRVVCNNIVLNKGNIDGTIFKYGVIDSSGVTSNIVFQQGVILDGDIINCDIIDKYTNNYVSLLLNYTDSTNTFVKYSNLNNNDYGYSYFYNLNSSLVNCNISSGNYHDCHIENISGSEKYIDGGYFYNCLIDEYHIYDGYFRDTEQLTNSCVWHYGKWDGNTFDLSSWEDGIFLNGIFGIPNQKTIWQNGLFLNGTWKGLVWANGDFSGGVFLGTGYTEYSGQKIGTQWFDGKFRGGVMTNGAFNTIFWKDGDVYGGELNNVIFNSGNIYDGVFYNIAAKNVNIYGGDFRTIKGSTPKFNTFTNSKIYDGNFSSDWCFPNYSVYVTMFGTFKILNYTYGYNEFSDSEINNGVFKYPIFYNFNTINNGDFEDGIYISPIDVYNGKFYGGKSNKVKVTYSGVSYLVNPVISNQFNSEKVTMSKGSIRSKILLNDSGVTETKMYIEFDNGHNFNEYDAGKIISMIGFNSQELYNTNSVIIQKNKYFDLSKPSSMLVSSYTYEYAEPIGDNYIIIEKPYKSWMFGDTGLIKKMEWHSYTIASIVGLTTSASTDYYNIHNGTFNNSKFFGNVNIYDGVFSNATMKNGIQWYNGVFDGGIFQSQSGKSDNIWHDGQFYNGVFGLNVLGQKETSRLTSFIDKCEIDNSSLGPQTSTTYLLQAIYPLVYSKVVELGSTGIGSPGGLSAFLTSDNTLSLDWLRMVTDDRSKKYMNTSVWGRETPYAQSDITSGSVDYFISPYNFVFRIDCDSYNSRMTLKKMLDFVASDTSYNVSIISPSDPVDTLETIMIGETAVTYSSRTYRTFQEMFGMSYDYVEYIMGVQSGSTYPMYIIFRFNTIKDLYDNCTDSEKELFALNFRNVWSIANTGYYTHPMPVLYGLLGSTYYGNEDTQKVGNMSIKLSTGTYVTNNKWIYGTCPPPWWISGSTTPYINWNVMFTENGITPTLIDSVGTYTNSIGSKISNNGITCDGYTIPENLISSRIYDSINRSVYDVDELSTTNYQTPYMRRRFTEWLFHYIYQHKNHSGYNFSSGVSFRQIYNDQVLADPKFNIVKDFRTQANCKLNNLIYNSQVFKCQVIGRAVYFDNNFKLSDYFSIGDKIYLENTTVLAGGGGGISGTESFAAFALPPSPPIADTSLNDGEYTITQISAYTYSTYRSNVLWITGFGVSNDTNSSANAYIMNQGLIVPYYYYVGKNDVYGSMNSQCNSETFFYMAPSTTSITSSSEYSETANTFISLNYKQHTNKLAIRMQPIFHTYYPEPGFFVNRSGFYESYYQHRNVYYCQMSKPGSNYRLTFKNVIPWGINSGETLQNANFNNCIFSGIITGSTGLTSYLNSNNIRSAWKYDPESTNWISLSYYLDPITNNKIKGTWRVGNSGITGSDFYVDIIDPNFSSVPSFTLPTNYVHVGIEPTPSCAGKIVNIMYKNAVGTIKTINTTILDYDFVNKAYIFDVSVAGVYMNATDIWLGTNMKSYNVFNLSTGVTLTSPYTVVTPSSNPSIFYNVANWNPISPFSMTKSTVTFPNSFEKLSVNPYRDYLVSTIIKYSGTTFGTSPISAQRIVDINDVAKTTPTSIIYDGTLNKFIYEDITSFGSTIYATSIPSGYTGTWSRDGRNYEQQQTTTTDYWNNTHLLEKIAFIRTKTSSVEILTTDKIQIEILSNYNTNVRPIIKEVNFSEKMSDNELKSLYPDYHIDSYSGMTRFGVYQVESNDSQNRIWSYMKSNIANNLPNDLVWYYGDVDYSNYHNFQDAALFSVYHSYMKNNLSNYSSFDIDDVFMRYLFYDMKNLSSGYSNIYNNILTETDKENFKNWNSRVQTSTQNFNKKAGIQIYSRNVSANIDDFKDQWYNGEFYGYKFEGAWHGGKWISGNWFGWNSLNTDETTTGDTAFIKPSDFDLSAKPKLNYETNYALLKKKKKYYDIAPWDEANKNNSETINLPLRKKDR